jgi:hypothetical protein
MSMSFQINPDGTSEVSHGELDPLDVLYAYSLLCTGITEIQALELNEAHTKARQRVKTLRETIQSVIEDSRTDQKVKKSLTKILSEL